MPLPRPLLARLRSYWKHERATSTTPYLFVPPNGEAPLHETTLQKTFTAARTDAGLRKHASVHTLRHSYATHLLESGVSLRTGRPSSTCMSRSLAPSGCRRSSTA